MLIRSTSLLISIILLATTGTASAEDITAAKMHYEKGTTLFDLQRYLDAAREYEAAFESKNDPALLFNIGQAYRFGGDYPKAIAAFKSFLRRLPEAENRAEVETRIAELQKLIDEQKRNQQAPPSGTLRPGETPAVESAPASTPSTVAATPPIAESETNQPSPQRARTKLFAGIGAAAVGVAAVVVGGVFEGLAKSKSDSLTNSAPGTVFNPADQRSIKTYETAGPILLGIGGAAIVTGAVLAIVGARERRPTRMTAVPSFGRNLAGVSVNASF
jgi:tetratricopeptide (TPR) repeat protein